MKSLHKHSPNEIYMMMGGFVFAMLFSCWLGKFIGYKLDEIFNADKNNIDNSLFIEEDPFIRSKKYSLFNDFNNMKNIISRYLNFDDQLDLNNDEINYFINSNNHLIS